MQRSFATSGLARNARFSSAESIQAQISLSSTAKAVLFKTERNAAPELPCCQSYPPAGHVADAVR